MLALQRLTQGESGMRWRDLGYESASGFVTMFRKAVGKPPARATWQSATPLERPRRRDYQKPAQTPA